MYHRPSIRVKKTQRSIGSYVRFRDQIGQMMMQISCSKSAQSDTDEAESVFNYAARRRATQAESKVVPWF
jgi:hypothetical protein